MLFSAAQGAGAQLTCATFILLVAALIGAISITKRGALLTAMIVIYCVTSIVGGFTSAKLYKVRVAITRGT